MCWLCGTNLFLEHSPHVFNGVQVRTLWRLCWPWQWHKCATHFILTVVCTGDLRTCRCFAMAPKWLSWCVKINNALFEMNVNLFRLYHCSVCGWVWWLYQTSPNKMGPEMSLAFVNQNYSVKRPWYKEYLIDTPFCYHQNWSSNLLYVYFWSSRFGHIFRRTIIN